MGVCVFEVLCVLLESVWLVFVYVQAYISIRTYFVLQSLEKAIMGFLLVLLCDVCMCVVYIYFCV